MTNERGTLAGWSDPSEPGWQERLVAKVEEYHRTRLKGRRHRVTPLRACHLDVTHSIAFTVLLRDAAARRGLTKVSYARRAIAAFIAHDHALPYEQVAALMPQAVPLGEVVPGKASTPDDGHGYGAWRIEGLT